MIRVKRPEAFFSGTEFRLRAKLEYSDCAADSETRDELFFALPREYADFVNPESSDCFLLGILYYAMRCGQNLQIEGTVSAGLLKSLRSDTMQLLSFYNPNLRVIDIAVGKTAVFERGDAVGTGFSGGIDSFFTVCDGISPDLPPQERVSLLFFFNAGTHGLGNSAGELAATERKFRSRYETLRAAAADTGLPFIPVDSNLHSFLPDNILSAISLENTAMVYFLQNKLKEYRVASAGHNYRELFEFYAVLDREPHVSMAGIEPMLLPLFSTSNLKITPSGTGKTRIQKTLAIADYPPARRFLNVCNSTAVIDKNCSECLKCRRTMTDLEILGKLDNFDGTLDAARYRREFKGRDFAALLHPPKEDSFARSSAAYALAHGVDLSAPGTFGDRICARLNGSWLYHVLKKTNALNALKKLLGRNK